MNSFRAPILAFLLVAMFQPALACKCVATRLDERLERTEVALVGRVVVPYTQLHERGLAELEVSDSFKGTARVGARIALNPASGTSCAARVPADTSVLVFGRLDSEGTLNATECTIFGTEPMRVDGELHQPDSDVTAFIAAHRALRPDE